jgi:hypothetical protein
MRNTIPTIGIAAGLSVVAFNAVAAQLPLQPPTAEGLTTTPAFEGWYRNADGTYSLSFGYFNRNFEQVIEIPVGPDNFFGPGQTDRGQPARFEPRRHWGVFAVRVPADFGDGEVVWTLNVGGQTFAIPGSLDPLWEIDALAGEAGSGNTPPVLRFAPDGQTGAGPAGITASPRTVKVGQPLTLEVWATDDGRTSGSVASAGRSDVPVQLTWLKHRGPGDVTFTDDTPDVGAGDRATTTATFAAPGEYVLRVRANDASGVSGAGHAQCCWTNGFVKVSVNR